MQTKILEIRDEGTRVDVLAIKMQAATPMQAHYLGRSGYPGKSVVLMRLADQKATSDAFEWSALGAGSRTMQNAHMYIVDNWDRLSEGDVVDVEYIIGETPTPKQPERLSAAIEAKK